MNEEWIDVVGYEEQYQVSSMGNVRSKERIVMQGGNTKIAGVQWPRPVKGRVLNCHIKRNGYKAFKANLKGGTPKLLSVHRLVAEYFVPNPQGKPQVNHINGIKSDARAVNLEWVTHQENVDHYWKNLVPARTN